MTAAAELVKAVRRLDRELEETRQVLADVADRRGNAIAKLLDTVGGTETARLLGLSRTAVYRAARR